jgi:hypothetical protein
MQNKKKNKKQNTMSKNTKKHTLIKQKSLLAFTLFSFRGLPWGATLNSKTSHPRPNSNAPPKPREWIQIFIRKPIQSSLLFSCNFRFWFSESVFTWVRTLKLGFSLIFTQNENSWSSMWELGWEPIWEPGHPVRTAQHCYIYLCGGRSLIS